MRKRKNARERERTASPSPSAALPWPSSSSSWITPSGAANASPHGRRRPLLTVNSDVRPSSTPSSRVRVFLSSLWVRVRASSSSQPSIASRKCVNVINNISPRSNQQKLRTEILKCSLRWHLYMISGFDDSNIRICEIAIDMGETNFGSVSDGTVSSSPWLKRAHWSEDLSEFHFLYTAFGSHELLDTNFVFQMFNCRSDRICRNYFKKNPTMMLNPSRLYSCY